MLLQRRNGSVKGLQLLPSRRCRSVRLLEDDLRKTENANMEEARKTNGRFATNPAAARSTGWRVEKNPVASRGVATDVIVDARTDVAAAAKAFG